MADQPQITVIQAVQGQYKLNLPQSAVAHVDVVDVDLVIQTKSGARIILAGAAIDSTGEHPPMVTYTDGSVSSAQMFDAVAQVQSLAVPVPAMASMVEYEAKKTTGPKSFVKDGKEDNHATPQSDDASQAAAGAPPDVAPLSEPAQSTVEKLIADADQMMTSTATKHGDYQQPPVPLSEPSAPASPPPGNNGGETPVTQPASLQVWFGNVSGTDIHGNELYTSGNIIYGGGGVYASDPRNYNANSPVAANSSLQISPEIIYAGTGKTVYVDGVGPLLGQTGSPNADATTLYSKVFQVHLLGTYHSTGDLYISGVPTAAGFSIVSLNSDFTVTETSAGTYTVHDINTSSSVAVSAIPVELVYPTDYAGGRFTLQFEQTILYDGQTSLLVDDVVAEVAAVTSTVDLQVTTPDPLNSTKTTYVDILPSNGVPNIVYAAGSDTVFGGIANDTMVSQGAANTFDGGAGTNTVDFSGDASSHTVNLATNVNSGGTAQGDSLVNVEVVIGGNYGDTITGNATTSTTIYGGSGNDTLAGGSAGDYFDGGAGQNTVTYATLRSGTAVTVDQTGHGYGSGDAAGDVYVNVETIVGSPGNDTFIGGNAYGAATMVGGGGSDTIDYEHLGGGIGATVNLATGSGTGAATYDHFSGIQNAVGSVYNDTFTASSAANSFDGGAGNDTVTYASSGSVTIDQTGGGHGGGDATGDVYVNIETIVGSGAADTFIGGTAAGSAVMDGGAGSNWIDYQFVSGGQGATINLASQSYSGAAAHDQFVNIENVTGSQYDDTFVADSATNTFDGGAGINTLDFSSDGAAHTINLATNQNYGGTAQNDKYYNVEVLVGGAGDDILSGNATTSTTLMGGGGNDTLAGGSAADYFDGGTGSNVVTYATLHSGSSVTVDQTTGGGTHGAGDAAGDVYVNIQTIIGSAGDDTFIGDTSGSAVMDGGGHVNGDWIDYEYDGGAAATIDLATGSGSGAAAGDHFVNIENVTGSSGNDTFTASAAANSFVGGGGIDVVDYADSASPVTINLAAGAAHSGGDAAGDSFTGIATVIATSGADTFIGGTTAGSALMDGGGGSDWIDYQYLSGGQGVTVNLSTAIGTGTNATIGDQMVNIENIRGSDYADVLTGTATGSTLLGGAGDDTLTGGAGADYFDGGAGNDTVTYSNSTAVTIDQTVSGGTHGPHAAGDAVGDVYVNVETIVASAGDDTFIGGTASGSAVMDGSAGNNWIDYEYVTGTTGATVNLGTGSGSGAALNDHFTNIENIRGSANSDTFIAAAGMGTIDGGGGNDTVDYSAATTDQVVNLTDHTQNAGSLAAGSTLLNIEVLIGGSGDDTFTGNATAATTLIGGAGDDTLYGGAGNDTLIGGAGADYMDGGAGVNTVDYSGDTANLTINLAANQAANPNHGGTAEGDQLYNIQVVVGGSGDDQLTGNATTSTTLYGGAGNDTFVTGSAADYVDGGSGINTVDYSGDSANHTINLATDVNIGGNADGDVLLNIEVVKGGSGTDIITGNANVSNTLYGGGGDDTLAGGAQADVLDGGSGTNTVSYANSTAGVTVNLATDAVSGGWAQGDTITNFENVIGSSHNDVLIAAPGGSTLMGGAGNDTLLGGAGNDTLDGGPGADYMDGGGGSNVVTYADSTSPVTIDLTNHGLGGGDAAGDVYVNIETIIATNGADTFIGGTSSGSITMDGSGGSDWVSYVGAATGATVNLATGVNGGAAAYDHLVNIENIAGSNYNDVLTGFATVGTSLLGGGGDDTLAGGAGADYFDGGSGNNVVTYANLHTTGTTSVTVDQTGGGYGTGDAHGDVYVNIETIIASPGDDTFIGGTAAGSATMDGSTGNNWVDYEHLAGGIGATIDLSSGTGSGAAANDHLVNIENVTGSAYNDTFYASSVANSFVGNGGQDVVSYAHSSAAVTVDQNSSGTTPGSYGAGDAQTDWYGGIATIIGTTGNDTFMGGTASGSATMDGSGGTNWIDYEHLSGGVGATLDLGSGSGSGAAANDHLVNVENVIGSAYDDTFYADNAVNSIDGGGGVNTIDYSADSANHTIDLATDVNTGGYAQGDKLSNITVIVSGAGDDVLTGNATTSTTFFAGAGNDTMVGGSAADYFDGGAGNDTVSYAASAAVTVDQTGGGYGLGDAHGDTYVNVETIIGSANTDTFIGGTGTGSATMVGGGGSDWIDYEYAGSATVNLQDNTANAGSAQYDRLSGIENVIASNSGGTYTGDTLANTFMAGAGTDSFIGGGGTDVVSYARSSSGVVIDQTGGDRGTGYAQHDTYAAIATIIGTSGDDTFTGGAGVSGTALMDGAGNTSGTGGGDWIDYSHDGGVLVTVNLSTATATGIGSGFANSFVNIENVRGSSASDTFVAGSGTSTLDGGSGGADWVNFASDGTAGVTVNLNATTGTAVFGTTTDHLLNIENATGTTGNDTFIAAAAAGTLDGGSGGADWVNFASDGTAGVTVNLSAGTAVFSTTTDHLLNIENAVGTAGIDTFIAGAAAGTLDGLGGSDWVNFASDGTAGVTVNLNATTGTAVFGTTTDHLLNIENAYGTTGNDTFIAAAAAGTLDGGGGGVDWVNFASDGTAGVTVNLSAGTAVFGTTTDHLLNIENATGTTGNDTFIAAAAAGTLDGGGGGADWVNFASDGTSGVTVNLSAGTAVFGTTTDHLLNIENAVGTAGIDTFIAGAAAGTLDGQGGSDWVNFASDGTAGVTVNLNATTGTAVFGTTTDHLLNIENAYGTTGNDTFIAAAAAGTLDGGGGGVDWVNFASDGTSGVTVNLSAGTAVFSTTTDHLLNIENAVGTAGIDTFIAGAAAGTLDGQGGSDWVNFASDGTAGVTVNLNATTGTAVFGTTTDHLLNIENATGTTGNDTFIAAAAAGTLDGGGGGVDWVNFASDGTAGVTVNLSAGTAVFGTTTDHLLNIENATGTTGNDTFIAAAAAGTLDGGGGGADWVNFASDGTSGVTVNLSAGTAVFGTTTDHLLNIENAVGTAGIDTFIAGAAAGTLDGQGGSDWVNFASDGTAGVTVNLNATTGTAVFGTTTDHLLNIENATGTTGNDTFIAAAAAGTLDGGSGGADWVNFASDGTSGVTVNLSAGTAVFGTTTDHLLNIENVVGTAGIDTFIAGAAAGTLDGQGGSDWVNFASDGTAGVTVNLNATTGTAVFGTTTDHLLNIENATGTTGNDTFIAAAAAGTLDGGGGGVDWVNFASDGTSGVTVNLSAGTAVFGTTTDTLLNIENATGTTGNDTFIAGTAAGTLDGGGGGADWVNFASDGTSSVTVNLSAGTAVFGTTTDHLLNIENAVGTAGIDTFIAGAAAGTLDGQGGSDWVNFASDGTAGVTVNLNATTGTAVFGTTTDHLLNIENATGTTGNDTFIAAAAAGTLDGGGGGVDWVNFASDGTSGVTVNLSAGTAVFGTTTDTLLNIENATGTTGNDTFIAGTAAGTLDGGGGGADWVNFASDGTSSVTVNLSAGTAVFGTTTDHLLNIENAVGTAGIDTFIAGAAAGTLDGQGGSDWVNFASDGTAGVTVNLNATTGTAVFGTTTDHLLNIENATGTTGNDTFIAAAAAGTLDGGSGGADWVNFASDGTAGVTVNLSAGTAVFSTTTDHLLNIENAVGTAGIDTFIAGAAAGTLDGQGGSDWVNFASDGTAGVTVNLNATTGTAVFGTTTDHLLNIENATGTTGNDTFIAAAAAGTLDGGGGGADWVNFASDGTAGVTVNLSAGTAVFGTTTDHLLNIENATGTTGNDTFIAGTAAGTLDGGGGGVDWVNFASDGTSGVTVNLSAGTAVFGTTTDHLLNIENAVGTAGIDTFIAGSGTSTFDGGSGSDWINLASDGTSGVVVNLAAATQTAVFGTTTDTLVNIENVVGTAGTDTFIAGSGTSTFDGAGGTNWIDYASATSAATVVLGGTNSGSAANDTLISIENIIASSHGDKLTGDAANNSFISGAGADTIDGGGGVNTVDYSGDGFAHVIDLADNSKNTGGTATGDILSNIEVVIGGNSGDTITGNATTTTTIDGGSSADLFYGGSAADSFDGGGGIDTVSYGNSTVTTGLTVDLGNTSLSTGDAAGDHYTNVEIIKGSTYDDTFIGGTATTMTMDGGGSADGKGDWIDYSSAAVAVTVNLTSDTGIGTGFTDHLLNIENITGSASADSLTGDGLANTNNTINAGGGDDVIFGSNTAGLSTHHDYIDGGSGTDTVNYSADVSGVDVYLAGYDAQGHNYTSAPSGYVGYGVGNLAQGDYYVNIENIVGGSAQDILIGSGGGNSIFGGGGNDTIGPGKDVADGGRDGNDYLDGGTGTNTLTYAGEATGVTIYLAGTDQTGSNPNSSIALSGGYTGYALDNGYTDFLANFENVVGTSNTDVIFGSGADNVFTGNGGNDTIYGMAGNDTFIGGSSLGGNEYLDGGTGTNTVNYSGHGSAVIVTLGDGSSAGSATDGSGSFLDTLVNIENIIGNSGGHNVLTGNSSGNVIMAGDGGDTLSGGGTSAGGVDTLVGGNGADTFLAGLGTETINGGSGTNTLDYHDHIGGGVTIDLATHTASGTGIADTFSNIQNLIGADGGSNVLTGDTNNNVIQAGSFGDTLAGGGGTDTLLGGAGADTFLAGQGHESIDGGGGSNTVDYAGHSSGVIVDLTAGTATDSGSSFTDSLVNIENIIGSGNADTFTLTATQLAGGDHVDGGGGSDTLNVNDTTGNTSLDFSTLASNITNIGTVNVNTHTATNENFTVSGENIESIVNNGQSSVLTLNLHSGDTLTIGGSTGDYAKIDGVTGTSISDVTASHTVAYYNSSAQEIALLHVNVV